MPDRVPANHDQRRQAIEQFAAELQQLRARAGNPSFRQLAGRSGRISHTTLHEAAAGHRLATWATTREFVRACGGDEELWRARWEQAVASVSASPSASGRIGAEYRAPGPETPPDGAARLVRTGPAAAGPATTPEPATATGPATTSGPAATAGPAQSEPAAQAGSIRLGKWRSAQRLCRKLAALATSVTALNMIVGAAPVLPADETPRAVGTPAAPRVSGDRSRFIADVTIPDGTVVKPRDTFVKVWEIQNGGTVPWYGRYLQREDLPPAPDGCRTPDRVPIGTTLPNERVKVSVTVTAPDRPGVCMVKWKMVDERGQLFFPGSRPVYFLIEVGAPD